MIDNDTNTQSGTTTPDADLDAGWSDVPVDCDPDAGWSDQPVEPTGQLTMGSIPDADLDRMIAATAQPADEEYTYRDAYDTADAVHIGIAKGPWFAPRKAFVHIGVTGTDEGEEIGAAALLDAGTAVVMALDLLGAAVQVMHIDPGPFERMNQADYNAADAAIRTRRSSVS